MHCNKKELQMHSMAATALSWLV